MSLALLRCHSLAQARLSLSLKVGSSDAVFPTVTGVSGRHFLGCKRNTVKAQERGAALNTLESLLYPYDVATINRKHRALQRELKLRKGLLPLKVAFLCSNVSAELVRFLELFLLNRGYSPEILDCSSRPPMESVMFDDGRLKAFQPDLAVVYTSLSHLSWLPSPGSSDAEVEEALRREIESMSLAWERLMATCGCSVVQMNFPVPRHRVLGNSDFTEIGGISNYLLRLNLNLTREANRKPGAVVCDLSYWASWLGVDNWYDLKRWYAYRILETPQAGALLMAKLAALVDALRGRSKKCLVLDLDNTLWGGVVGEEGVAGLKLNRGDPLGDAFLDFQAYVKSLKSKGVILAVASKNDDHTARQGFLHPECLLSVDDFSSFQANWEPKVENLQRISAELNIGTDSLVFFDDNPAERLLVRRLMPEVCVPEVGDVTGYIRALEGESYFESIGISADDLNRTNFYLTNAKREEHKASHSNYSDYLTSLEMTCSIVDFQVQSLDRITQLFNKTNQFNLTTLRLSRSQVDSLCGDPSVICLQASLTDRFGDNGLVSLFVGKVSQNSLEILAWLMSCRVLKRGLELALFDEVVRRAQLLGLAEIHGEYKPTEKNALVSNLYEELGFERLTTSPSEFSGRPVTRWKFFVGSDFIPKNTIITRRVLVDGPPVDNEESSVRFSGRV